MDFGASYRQLTAMDERYLLAVVCGAPVLLFAVLAAVCGPGKVFEAMTCGCSFLPRLPLIVFLRAPRL